MSDIALVIKNGCFDINIKNGDLEADDGLETAIAISIFTDRRVSDEELPYPETSKRGWWGDIYSEVDQDKIGSRLWTLNRAKRTTETLRRSEELARESLKWMIEDSIASEIEIESTYNSDNYLIIAIDINRPDDDNARFSVVWDKQEIRRL